MALYKVLPMYPVYLLPMYSVQTKDKTRNRNYNLVGNLAVLRNTLLVIVSEHREQYGSLPAFTEAFRANESEAYRLITKLL